ncbi:hypothetical protein DFH08DRAFT_391028 [Mycena albidolilacea]|uniref:Uncharacterized protein n=1 Tax=Mycena albidolilacea TaxID=1033008 RepID=A0AAD6ZF56_9AGAR|nr:hypothetical protein DFH08DRAFT_391028 [Mycena albidolilacea]
MSGYFSDPTRPCMASVDCGESNLRQLSADINPLFIRDRVDFNHSIFAGITHLDMFETPLSETGSPTYAAFLVSHTSGSISTAQILLSTLFMCITLSQIQNPSRFSYSFSGMLIIKLKQNSMICTNVSATIHGLWLCLFLISWGIGREVPPVETITGSRRNDSSRSGDQEKSKVRLG